MYVCYAIYSNFYLLMAHNSSFCMFHLPILPFRQEGTIREKSVLALPGQGLLAVLEKMSQFVL